jgi:hypothetical protein
MELELDGFLKKYSNIKFHKNLCSGSQVVPYGWTDTDMMKLTVTFCSFENPPKKNDKAQY